MSGNPILWQFVYMGIRIVYSIVQFVLCFHLQRTHSKSKNADISFAFYSIIIFFVVHI